MDEDEDYQDIDKFCEECSSYDMDAIYCKVCGKVLCVSCYPNHECYESEAENE